MVTMGDALANATTQAEMSSFFIDKMGIYNVLSYAAGTTINDGVTDAYNASYDCSAAADDNGGIMFFPVGTYIIGADITFPANVTLWFADGAKLSPSTGKTVTINGNIKAGQHQIFTGAGTITLGYKGMEVYPNWFGVVSDGTDQTTNMTSFFTKLGSGYRGIVKIPYNTKFTITTVYTAMPIGVVLLDHSAINFKNSAVYKNKMIVVGSKDLDTDDTDFMIMSGHHPALILNNLGIAGTASATDRKNSILFARGIDSTGNPDGYFLLQGSKHTTLDQWNLGLRLQKTYLDPTTLLDTGIFGITENGHMGVGQGASDSYNLWVQNHPVAAETTTSIVVENNANSSEVRFYLLCKDAGGITKGKIFRMLNSGHLALRKADNSASIWIIDDNGNGRYYAGVSGSSFTTAARPAIVEVGTMVFDSTLGKPVWLKSTGPNVWVDAAGTTV